MQNSLAEPEEPLGFCAGKKIFQNKKTLPVMLITITPGTLSTLNLKGGGENSTPGFPNPVQRKSQICILYTVSRHAYFHRMHSTPLKQREEQGGMRDSEALVTRQLIQICVLL